MSHGHLKFSTALSELLIILHKPVPLKDFPISGELHPFSCSSQTLGSVFDSLSFKLKWSIFWANQDAFRMKGSAITKSSRKTGLNWDCLGQICDTLLLPTSKPSRNMSCTFRISPKSTSFLPLPLLQSCIKPPSLSPPWIAAVVPTWLLCPCYSPVAPGFSLS